MIEQIIYIAVMLAVVSLLAKNGILFDYYLPGEYDPKPLTRLEKKASHKRLEEIRHGCW